MKDLDNMAFNEDDDQVMAAPAEHRSHLLGKRPRPDFDEESQKLMFDSADIAHELKEVQK